MWTNNPPSDWHILLPLNWYVVLAATILAGTFVAVVRRLRAQAFGWSGGRPILVSGLGGGLFAAVLSHFDLSIAIVFGSLTPVAAESLAHSIVQASTRVTEIRANIRKAKADVEKEPGKTRPLWELSRAQLELYIARNLSQVGSIFWITLVVMAASFALVSYGVYLAYNGAPLAVGVLASGSGIITQFVGATFLLIYRSTMAQASGYVEMLERINTVGMAVQIVDLIPDENAEKNKTRGDLVRQILHLRVRSSKSKR
jgi:hypothetical protein